MEDATDEASLFQSCGCNRRGRRDWSDRYRRFCLRCARRLRRGFLRRQTSGRSEEYRKNNGETNHRRVKHEKVALSIDHEIHFRESDSGTFGHFCHW